jgi:hypothetical protein
MADLHGRGGGVLLANMVEHMAGSQWMGRSSMLHRGGRGGRRRYASGKSISVVLPKIDYLVGLGSHQFLYYLNFASNSSKFWLSNSV